MEALPDIGLPLAPAWSLALGSFGRAAIWVAACAFAATVLGILLPRVRASAWPTRLFALGSAGLFAAFVSLAVLFVGDRFEFKYVYDHAQTDNAVAYKIAGIWSGQQGSFLLWAVCSALFGLASLRGTGPYRSAFLLAYSAFLGSIAGILAYETPYKLNLIHGKAFVPTDGVGLTPALQNYWVVIHPPVIFLGFGCLTVLFAYGFSALLRRDYAEWAPRVRGWAILSATLLGLGLCLGGFWAYETLGWGGFWKWDPVENVSFVPWCMAIALIHGVIVQISRNRWHFSNLLLAGLPFLLFVYGTFLTRAGFLDGVSVHSFAKMDRTAHKVLLTFCLTSLGGYLLLWAVRWFQDRPRTAPEPASLISRETTYQAGNVLLALTGLATGIGMSVPLFQVLANQKPKVVEEPLYHQVLAWFVIPILLLMAIGPFVSWRTMGLRALGGRLINVVSLTLGLVGVVVLVMKHPEWGIDYDPAERIKMPWGSWPAFPWIMTLFGLCAFAAVASLYRTVESLKRGKSSAAGFLAHLGVAVALAGLIVSRGLERKQEVFVQDGVPAPALEHFITYQGIGENLFKHDNKVKFLVAGRQGSSYVAQPGLYNTQNGTDVQPMVWPDIREGLTHDLYFTLHPPVFEAGDPITLKPGEEKPYEILQFAEGKIYKYKIRFVKLNRIGEAGAAGTRFSAELVVTTEAGEQHRAAPYMELTSGGVIQPPALINADYFVRLERMDAADGSVTLQVGFTKPVYPIELYYKPLTSLVWLGTGILTIGGLWSAFSRRFRRRATAPTEAVESSKDDDATLPTAKGEAAPRSGDLC